MERRSEERYEVRFEAKVTAMGRSVFASVSNISQSGISVDLPFQFSVGDSAELRMADSTVYGQVVYSEPDHSTFRTGIQASKVTLGGTDLSNILQMVLMENLPLIPGLEPTDAHVG